MWLPSDLDIFIGEFKPLHEVWQKCGMEIAKIVKSQFLKKVISLLEFRSPPFYKLPDAEHDFALMMNQIHLTFYAIKKEDNPIFESNIFNIIIVKADNKDIKNIFSKGFYI